LGEFIKLIENAISDIRNGKFVLIHDADDREGETDLVMASEFVTPESIKIMRKEGGGLIFIMLAYDVAKKLDLPFLSDLFLNIENNFPILKKLAANDIPYDSKSSFSLYINHRKTFTGISDIDRSLTMKKFAELTKRIKNLDNDESQNIFGNEFRSPGHIPICISSKNLLLDRFGHTELVIALLELAGITPVGSGCEIIGDNGRSLSKISAQKYAEENNLVFLEGKDIVKEWRKWSK
jgi:3,4-dihydroxy 2-butanone 4-phosphate synthase